MGQAAPTGGSPPRMRGKACVAAKPVCMCGITPAHAGKSHAYAINAGPFRDHPRACGEKSPEPEFIADDIGSPPRMRGKAKNTIIWIPACRITPAHAGKSRLDDLAVLGFEDHPRACGEKSFQKTLPSPSLGSPPRMRGKAFPLIGGRRYYRITPAHAGKSPDPITGG